MLPFPLLFERFAALAILSILTILAGLPILSASRCRLGWLAAVPLGVAYWSISLFALPFRGGLFVASAILAGIWIAVWRFARGKRFLAPGPRADRVANLMLAGGALPFLTILAFQCVPPGADASMYATATRLIAQEEGLPRTFAPFFPEITFPAMNIGLAVPAALTCNFGISPAAATIATEPLSYACVIFGCFPMLRTWIRPRPAAFLAVAAALGIAIRPDDRLLGRDPQPDGHRDGFARGSADSRHAAQHVAARFRPSGGRRRSDAVGPRNRCGIVDLRRRADSGSRRLARADATRENPTAIRGSGSCWSAGFLARAILRRAGRRWTASALREGRARSSAPKRRPARWNGSG